jgi:hypothetical protein
MEMDRNPITVVLTVLFLIVVFVGSTIGGCAAYNTVRVWNAQQAGRAELAQATSNRQIKVLEAKAKEESATYEAKAEIARARGAAISNHILQNSLGGPAGYLRYLQIQALDNTKATLIYVPTEAGLPMLEATRTAPQQAEK